MSVEIKRTQSGLFTTSELRIIDQYPSYLAPGVGSALYLTSSQMHEEALSRNVLSQSGWITQLFAGNSISKGKSSFKFPSNVASVGIKQPPTQG